jgi:hypothetical protein
MWAICLIPKECYEDYRYIAEQTFLSLLHTWKGWLHVKMNEPKTDPNAADARYLKHFAAMQEIAAAAAKQSGWTGAAERRSFWQYKFANCEGFTRSALSQRCVWYIAESTPKTIR